MFQKVIIIMKSGSKKAVLKLAEGSGKVKVTLGEGIKFPSTLLVDCGMEYELKINCAESEFKGSIDGDVSAVLLTDDEVYLGTSGKRDKCQTLLFNYKNKTAAKVSEQNNDDKRIEIAAADSKAISNEFVQNENVLGEKSQEVYAKNTAKPQSNIPKENISAEKIETFSGERDKAEATVFFGGIEFSGNNFYQAVKAQLDEMFVCYPLETRLIERIPNSKWIRVDCENEYYVVGLIYELDEVIYVCYGIPGSDKILPPDEIKDVSQFVDIDLDGGVWMIFQDAKTGKCISSSDVIKI